MELSFRLSLETVSDDAEIGIITGCSNFLRNKVGSPKTTFVSISGKDGEYYLGLKTYDENGSEFKLIKNSLDDVNDGIIVNNEGKGLSLSHDIVLDKN